MNREPRFGWFGVVAIFLAGCVLTFLVFRFLQEGRTSVAPVAQGVSKIRWRVEQEFDPPRSIIVNSPDKTAILSFEFAKPKSAFMEYSYPVSIKNLSVHPYPVTYEVLAYDGQNRRVDDASDSATSPAGCFDGADD